MLIGRDQMVLGKLLPVRASCEKVGAGFSQITARQQMFRAGDFRQILRSTL